MRRFILAATFAVALGASANAQAPVVPAPVADGVQQVIDISQSNTTVNATVGERIAVTLIGKPSTGASWTLIQKPNALSDPERTSGPTTPPSASGRPVLGASRWDVFTFEVLAPGEELLRLEQRSVQGAQLQAFEITVVADVAK